MRKYFWLAVALAAFGQLAAAEDHSLTLKQALERALAETPEVIMSRMDELKATEGIRLAREPFSPRVYGGSGLAWSSGFPQSIDGSAPSIFQVKTTQDLFNKSQMYSVAQARENARGAGFASGERREDVAYRVAALYIDAERAGKLAEGVKNQVESLTKVLEAVTTRVDAGRELPVTRQEATVHLLRTKQRLMALRAERDYAEHNLAASLGFNPGDSVKPVAEERASAPIPDTEEAALRAAYNASRELKRLESTYQAKSLEIKSDKAQRLPRVDLVAQYALLSKYSHYDQYFNRFQYNNIELGASIQVPLLAGPGVKALINQAEADRRHIRAEIQLARGRIALEVHQSYQEIEKAEMARQVAKAELDLAHEQLSILLAQMNEGRAALKQVEEARFAENEKWIEFYDAQFNSEKARLIVLRHTGELSASLR